MRSLSCRKSRVIALLGALLLYASPMKAQAVHRSPSPVFSLAANGATIGSAYQGWPIIIVGTISNPQRFSHDLVVTPILIQPATGSWANNAQLSVTDSSGVSQTWPLQLVTHPSGSLSLDGMTSGGLVWVLSPAATSSIAPGKYRIIGILNTTGSSGSTGWNGIVPSNSINLTFTAAPSPFTGNVQQQQFRLLAKYDHLTGNDPQASSDLDTLLIQQPNAFGALAYKGQLLEQAGQVRNALDAYDRALAAFYATVPGPYPDPPVSLLIPQRNARAALMSQSGVRGKPQIAIRLLDTGTQSPSVSFLDLQITNVGNDVAENVYFKQFTIKTLSGTGQVTFNNVLSPLLPIATDFLAVNAFANVRLFFNVPPSVSTYSITESGTVADIFGTASPFTETHTLTAAGTLVGDVNGDGVVNCADLDIVKASFGKKTGQSGFDPRADVNGDGIVNILDLSTVARQLPAGTACQ
jgi:hypothetical protein